MMWDTWGCPRRRAGRQQPALQPQVRFVGRSPRPSRLEIDVAAASAPRDAATMSISIGDGHGGGGRNQNLRIWCL